MSTVTKVYTFTNGTKADATEVNKDFDDIYSAINGNLGAANLANGIQKSINGIINVQDPAYNASGLATTATGSIASGTKTLTLTATPDFVAGQGINLQGAFEASSLQVTGAATVSSNVTVTLNGVSFLVAVVSGDTAIQVATKIRAATYAGWAAGGTAGTDTVTFTSLTSGVKTDATYSAGTTGATGTMTTTTQGTADQISTVSSVSGLVVNIADNSTRTITAGTILHDDTAEIQTALTAGAGGTVRIPVPKTQYNITSQLSVPANTKVEGGNKQTTKLIKMANFDFMTLGDGATLEGLYLEGNGATYTGKGLVFSGTNGNQVVKSCRVINFESSCFDFAVSAGSRCSVYDVETWRCGGTTGTNLFAIVISATQQLSAVPRKFSMIETAGFCSFDFGGCNDTFITASFLGDLKYTADTRSAQISATRIANQAALAFNGHNNSIVGCDIAPQITIASGADACSIGYNSYNNALPIIDNSGNARNNLNHSIITYTPAITSGGTAPSLGNGTITGLYSKDGAKTSVTINLQLGTTTNLGTGGLFFSLPQARVSGDIAIAGTFELNRGGSIYTGYARVAGAVTTCALFHEGTGQVSATSPATFASGDTIRFSLSYSN